MPLRLKRPESPAPKTMKRTKAVWVAHGFVAKLRLSAYLPSSHRWQQRYSASSRESQSAPLLRDVLGLALANHPLSDLGVRCRAKSRTDQAALTMAKVGWGHRPTIRPEGD